MGKTESKILEVNNIYFEKSNRFSKDTSHNKYSLASNLTIFSSSLNIVKSSKNNNKINKTDLYSLINSKKILIESERLLSNFIPFQLSMNQNLCLISCTFQHTLKENCFELNNEVEDAFNIDIFIKGFLRFMNIFSNFLESKSRKLLNLLRIFKRNTVFQTLYSIDNKRLDSKLEFIQDESGKEVEIRPDSDLKSRNMKSNNVFDQNNNKNLTTKKSLKKNNPKSLSSNLISYKNNINNNPQSQILTSSNNIIKQAHNSNILIQDNTISKKSIYKNINKQNKNQLQTENECEQKIVSPEIRKNYSANRVLKTDAFNNFVSNSIDMRKYLCTQSNSEDKDFNIYKKDADQFFFQPTKNIINIDYSKNRLVKSVAQNYKFSLGDNSIGESKNISNISRTNFIQSSFSVKENGAISNNKSKHKPNKSMQIYPQPKLNTMRSPNKNTNFEKFSVSIKNNQIKSNNNTFNSNITEKTNHKKSHTQHSIKINQTMKISNTIDYDTSKNFSEKSEKGVYMINNKNKPSITVNIKEQNHPSIIYYNNKNNIQQNINQNNHEKNYNNKSMKNANPNTVQQLNVKININQLNHLHSNNNNFNNENKSQKMKNIIQLEKDAIQEEKENYSSSESNTKKLTRKSAEKNESCYSESDFNIDLVNANRHNTPAFNKISKSSDYNGNNLIEINTVNNSIETESNQELKFSFGNSENNNDTEGYEENDYHSAINYIIPRIGNLNDMTNHHNNKINVINVENPLKRTQVLNKNEGKFKLNRDLIDENNYKSTLNKFSDKNLLINNKNNEMKFKIENKKLKHRNSNT